MPRTARFIVAEGGQPIHSVLRLEVNGGDAPGIVSAIVRLVAIHVRSCATSSARSRAVSYRRDTRTLSVSTA